MWLSLPRSAKPRPSVRTWTAPASWGRVFIEELDRRPESTCERFKQPAGTDTIDALFVLLNLLERKSQAFAELFLAHAEQHAAQSDAATDVGIDRIGPARIFLQRITIDCGNHVFFACRCSNSTIGG